MRSGSVVVKPSSNGRNTDGTSMNVGNVLSSRPSIRLHSGRDTGEAMRSIISGDEATSDGGSEYQHAGSHTSHPYPYPYRYEDGYGYMRQLGAPHPYTGVMSGGRVYTESTIDDAGSAASASDMSCTSAGEYEDLYSTRNTCAAHHVLPTHKTGSARDVYGIQGTYPVYRDGADTDSSSVPAEGQIEERYDGEYRYETQQLRAWQHAVTESGESASWRDGNSDDRDDSFDGREGSVDEHDGNVGDDGVDGSRVGTSYDDDVAAHSFPPHKHPLIHSSSLSSLSPLPPHPRLVSHPPPLPPPCQLPLPPQRLDIRFAAPTRSPSLVLRRLRNRALPRTQRRLCSDSPASQQGRARAGEASQGSSAQVQWGRGRSTQEQPVQGPTAGVRSRASSSTSVHHVQRNGNRYSGNDDRYSGIGDDLAKNTDNRSGNARTVSSTHADIMHYRSRSRPLSHSRPLSASTEPPRARAGVSSHGNSAPYRTGRAGAPVGVGEHVGAEMAMSTGVGVCAVTELDRAVTAAMAHHFREERGHQVTKQELKTEEHGLKASVLGERARERGIRNAPVGKIRNNIFPSRIRSNVMPSARVRSIRAGTGTGSGVSMGGGKGRIYNAAGARSLERDREFPELIENFRELQISLDNLRLRSPQHPASRTHLEKTGPVRNFSRSRSTGVRRLPTTSPAPRAALASSGPHLLSPRAVPSTATSVAAAIRGGKYDTGNVALRTMTPKNSTKNYLKTTSGFSTLASGEAAVSHFPESFSSRVTNSAVDSSHVRALGMKSRAKDTNAQVPDRAEVHALVAALGRACATHGSLVAKASPVTLSEDDAEAAWNYSRNWEFAQNFSEISEIPANSASTLQSCASVDTQDASLLHALYALYGHTHAHSPHLTTTAATATSIDIDASTDAGAGTGAGTGTGAGAGAGAGAAVGVGVGVGVGIGVGCGRDVDVVVNVPRHPMSVAAAEAARATSAAPATTTSTISTITASSSNPLSSSSRAAPSAFSSSTALSTPSTAPLFAAAPEMVAARRALLRRRLGCLCSCPACMETDGHCHCLDVVTTDMRQQQVRSALSLSHTPLSTTAATVSSTHTSKLLAPASSASSFTTSSIVPTPLPTTSTLFSTNASPTTSTMLFTPSSSPSSSSSASYSVSSLGPSSVLSSSSTATFSAAALAALSKLAPPPHTHTHALTHTRLSTVGAPPSLALQHIPPSLHPLQQSRPLLPLSTLSQPKTSPPQLLGLSTHATMPSPTPLLDRIRASASLHGDGSMTAPLPSVSALNSSLASVLPTAASLYSAATGANALTSAVISRGSGTDISAVTLTTAIPTTTTTATATAAALVPSVFSSTSTSTATTTSSALAPAVPASLSHLSALLHRPPLPHPPSLSSLSSLPSLPSASPQTLPTSSLRSPLPLINSHLPLSSPSTSSPTHTISLTHRPYAPLEPLAHHASSSSLASPSSLTSLSSPASPTSPASTAPTASTAAVSPSSLISAPPTSVPLSSASRVPPSLATPSYASYNASPNPRLAASPISPFSARSSTVPTLVDASRATLMDASNTHPIPHPASSPLPSVTTAFASNAFASNVSSSSHVPIPAPTPVAPLTASTPTPPMSTPVPVPVAVPAPALGSLSTEALTQHRVGASPPLPSSHVSLVNSQQTPLLASLLASRLSRASTSASFVNEAGGTTTAPSFVNVNVNGDVEVLGRDHVHQGY